MDYNPIQLNSLFGNEKAKSMIAGMIPVKSGAVTKALSRMYQAYQSLFKTKKVIEKIKKLSAKDAYLSDPLLLEKYYNLLLLKLEYVKSLKPSSAATNSNIKGN
jgi:hypothetical protein